MKKRFYSVTNLILTSLITMLGFGGCKTVKTVEQNSEMNDNTLTIDTIDSAVPNKHREIRVLYGPPPTNKRVPLIKKEDVKE